MKQIKSIGRNVKITFDIEKLLNIKAELAKKYVARVGILGQKTNRIPMLTGESHERYKLRVKKMLKDKPTQAENEGQTNADIGLVHEMGSMARHIPRRSFLEMPLNLKMPEYARTFGAELKKSIEAGNIRPAFVKLGIKGEQVVQMAFASRGFGMWQKLSEQTIKNKGSDSPLIDSGQLCKSITSDTVTK